MVPLGIQANSSSATLAAAEQVDAVLLVELVARSGMICLLICDPKSLLGLRRGWGYLRIYVAGVTVHRWRTAIFIEGGIGCRSGYSRQSVS